MRSPGRYPAKAALFRWRSRSVVHLLLGHALVDEARHALRLVLRDVPSARPPQARAGAVGAGADRAAAVACSRFCVRLLLRSQ